MKRLIVVIATLAIFSPIIGCGRSTGPVDNTAGSSEAQEYEKRRADQREKGVVPKGLPSAPTTGAGSPAV